ncbi:Holliday junction resolvase RuvX [Bordetella sp. 2513F-2]
MPDETLLAFDYGEKKIGIAIGNTLTRQARPLEIIVSETRAGRFGRIAALLAEWQPQRVVVGLPLTAEGGEQLASVRARRFANQLHGRFGLRVELVDERGSSLEAQQLLGTNAADDAVAAAVILQRYLDALSVPGSAAGQAV